MKKFCPKCGAMIGLNEVCAKCNAERHRSYDTERRDKAAAAFYQSAEWASAKVVVHNKYHGLCLYSLLVLNELCPAHAVHHIVPLREDWGRRCDIANLIPLSASAHSRVEQMPTTEAMDLCRELLRKWSREYE